MDSNSVRKLQLRPNWMFFTSTIDCFRRNRCGWFKNYVENKLMQVKIRVGASWCFCGSIFRTVFSTLINVFSMKIERRVQAKTNRYTLAQLVWHQLHIKHQYKMNGVKAASSCCTLGEFSVSEFTSPQSRRCDWLLNFPKSSMHAYRTVVRYE